MLLRFHAQLIKLKVEIVRDVTVYYAVQGDSKFQVCEWNPSMWPLKWKL